MCPSQSVISLLKGVIDIDGFFNIPNRTFVSQQREVDHSTLEISISAGKEFKKLILDLLRFVSLTQFVQYQRLKAVCPINGGIKFDSFIYLGECVCIFFEIVETDG